MAAASDHPERFGDGPDDPAGGAIGKSGDTAHLGRGTGRADWHVSPDPGGDIRRRYRWRFR
jgi:hypothetical protein